MTSITFTINSCVCGYHVYKDIWDPLSVRLWTVSTKLGFQKIPMQSLYGRTVTVGHVPWTISCIFMLFLRHGGIIVSTITGPRKHSDDLPQGGLELPCTYRFIGPDNITKKAHQLLLNEQDGVSELQGMFTAAH